MKLSELKNATGAASAFNVAACSAAQTLVWSSLTDQFSCQDISLPASKVTGLATVATSGAYSDLTGTPTLNSLLPTQTGQNGNFLTTDGTNTSWAASSSQWTTSGSNIYYNTGNVGIGTTNPQVSLDLSAKTDAILPPKVAAAANSPCVATLQGGVRYNSTLNGMEMCDGANWQALGMGGSGSNTANAFSFTNLTEQGLGTLVASDIVTVTGFTGTLVASVSGALTAEININGSGQWVTSGAIRSGQTLQVRLTTSGLVSTPLTATVTVGTTQANWEVSTRSAALKIFLTAQAYLGSAIGGFSGADAIFQAAAGSAGLAGAYKAVLSSETTHAKDRLVLSYPIVNAYNGSTVAATNLWIGSISTGIKEAQTANWAPAWTGTHLDGTLVAGTTCDSWTGDTNGATGPSSGADWIYSASVACSQSRRLICIQQ